MREFIETSIDSEPAFVTEDVNLIYMGPMTGKKEAVIQKLLPYKDRIEELIRKKKCFLFTGNAMEVFFREIIDGERRIEGLNIFDFLQSGYRIIIIPGIIMANLIRERLLGVRFSHRWPMEQMNIVILPKVFVGQESIVPQAMKVSGVRILSVPIWWAHYWS